MKKVSVITMHCVKNYGSVLQTYATQLLISELGYQCVIIDYWRKKSLDENLLNIWCNNKPFILKCIMLPTINKWKKVFNSFLCKYINLTKEKYIEGDESFKKNPISSDIFCVGSNQVWNSKYNNGFNGDYFLDFTDSKNKMSFSASIGMDSINDNDKEYFLKSLSNFKKISVREESASALLQNIGLNNVKVILDPTLIASKETWKQLINKRIIKKKYLLLYQLNSNSEFDKYAKKIAKEKKLKLVRLCTRYDQFIKCGKPILPSVEEFLSLFFYVDFVLTDSFHGTSFCLNFNKEFAIVLPKRFSSRIRDLLCKLKLENRIVNSYNNKEFPRINYNDVNKKIQLLRDYSNNWLKEALSSFEIKEE